MAQKHVTLHTKIQMTFERSDGELILEVSVDQHDWDKFSGCETRDGVAVELFSKTQLANCIWSVF